MRSDPLRLHNDRPAGAGRSLGRGDVPAPALPLLSLVWLVAALGCAAGCRSTPQVDWPARVGEYTYDQAVVELGPPDKSTKLPDGTLVAEWASGRASGGLNVGVGTGFTRGRVGVGVGHTVYQDPPTRRWLRLTFGPDGRLTAHTTARR